MQEAFTMTGERQLTLDVNDLPQDTTWSAWCRAVRAVPPSLWCVAEFDCDNMKKGLPMGALFVGGRSGLGALLWSMSSALPS